MHVDHRHHEAMKRLEKHILWTRDFRSLERLKRHTAEWTVDNQKAMKAD